MTGEMLFRQQVQEALGRIGEETLRYNEDEFWMIQRRYRYVESYAKEKQLFNTAVALPLVRALHDGVHRKGTVLKDGVAWRLPYVYHCLMVCRMLIDLQLPLSHDEEDVVLAAALCHDLIEDIPFENGGREIVTRFGLDERVYETVKHVSKQRDFTEEEETRHFQTIAEDPFALLVKLSDRGNNVEDLYNMKPAKIREYIGETRTRIFPMCDYGKAHYPGLRSEIEILNEKMISLTETAEILVSRYEKRERELNARLEALTIENQRLKEILKEMGEA